MPKECLKYSNIHVKLHTYSSRLTEFIPSLVSYSWLNIYPSHNTHWTGFKDYWTVCCIYFILYVSF